MPRPHAGRKAGTPNRRTQDGLREAKRAVAEARAGGVKLGKEICSEFANIFCRLAMQYRPVTEHERKCGMKDNPHADIDKFKELSAILLGWVTALMPYQSAKFQSIRVDVGELSETDDEEFDALETLQKLLDAYAEAQEREQKRIEAEALRAPAAVEPAEPQSQDQPDNTQ